MPLNALDPHRRVAFLAGALLLSLILRADAQSSRVLHRWTAPDPLARLDAASGLGELYGHTANNRLFRVKSDGELTRFGTLGTGIGRFLKTNNGFAFVADGPFYVDYFNRLVRGSVLTSVTPDGNVTRLKFWDPRTTELAAWATAPDHEDWSIVNVMYNGRRQYNSLRRGSSGHLGGGPDPTDVFVAGSDGNLYYSHHSSEGASLSRGSSSDTGSVHWETLQRFPVGSGTVSVFEEAPDRSFYGLTTAGGIHNGGTIFRFSATGDFAPLVDIEPDVLPPRALTPLATGEVFGILRAKDAPSTVSAFRYRDGEGIQVIHDFAPEYAEGVQDRLVDGGDGALYGLTWRGVSTESTVFRLSPSGSFSVVRQLVSEPFKPAGGVLKARDGNFYGVTSGGGAAGCGTLYRLSADGDYTLLHDLSPAEGQSPRGTLVQAGDGSIYGTSYQGGGGNKGTVFRLRPETNEVSVVHSFSGPDGLNPVAGLALGADGNLYGATTAGGEAGAGTLYRISSSGTFELIHQFNVGDGKAPFAELLLGRDDNLYGVASEGGANGAGTFYRLTPDGIFFLLQSFPTGWNPRAKLVEADDGNFYGPTHADVSRGQFGGLYRASRDGLISNIYNGSEFEMLGSADTPLVQGADGHLYGALSRYTRGDAPVGSPALGEGFVQLRDSVLFRFLLRDPSPTFGAMQVMLSPDGQPLTFGNESGPFASAETASDLVFVGAADSSAFKITIPFSDPRNRPPVAVRDTFRVAHSRYGPGPGNGTFTTRDLLANDKDPDGDVPRYFCMVEGPRFGTVSLAGDTFTYSGNASGIAGDWFVYRIQDGKGGFADATVQLLDGDPSWNNRHPTPADDTFEARGTLGLEVSQLLRNDTDSLHFYGFATYPSHGQVVQRGPGMLTYTPLADYVGEDSFMYIVGNGHALAAATVRIAVRDQGPPPPPPGTPRTIVQIASGDLALGTTAGQRVYRRFGIPSIGAGGTIAFRAIWSTRGARGVEGGLFARLAGEPEVTALQSNGYFPVNLGEPIIDSSGERVAFSALGGAGARVILASASAVEPLPVGFAWTDRKREGAISDFTSLALAPNNGSIFTARLARRTKDSDRMLLAKNQWFQLVEGRPLTVDWKTRIVKRFVVLGPVPGSPGQRRSFNDFGQIIVRVVFTDGFEALVRIEAHGACTKVMQQGSLWVDVPTPGQSETLGLATIDVRRFGTPSINNAGHVACRAVLGDPELSTEEAPPLNAKTAVLVMGDPQSARCRVVAFTGMTAPGLSERIFQSFEEPVFTDDDQVAFVARASHGSHGRNHDVGLWRHVGGVLHLVARKGDAAVGIAGATFASFRSIALPSRRGVAFVAAFASSTEVTSRARNAKQLGFWAQDTSGELRLLLREGQPLGDKVVRRFSVLSRVLKSPGQGHSYSADGRFVARVSFTDHTEAIVEMSVL